MKKLKDIKKRDEFKAPEGYFEQFPLRMQKRLEMEQSKPAIRLSTASLPIIRYAMAAMVILMLGIGVYLFLPEKQGLSEHWLSDVSNAEIISYLESSYLDADDFFEQDLSESLLLLIAADDLIEWEEFDEASIEYYLEQSSFDFDLID
ncbi:MAG TPA: hypothetical protein PKC24_14235 [Cyclobacteriaceae bacterium]|nr:hypothetical protein [Cyclobacteriaceae bacterium]